MEKVYKEAARLFHSDSLVFRMCMHGFEASLVVTIVLFSQSADSVVQSVSG